ncbi:MAG: SGNH/GDSL hydrolase family protein, partial [Actinobacteria bacterium]|nr:SGNH/GDSL hydrolase family protein [Actinomycetota bacterium]
MSRWLIWLAVMLTLTAASIAVALTVTPLQTVAVAGQEIQVGATTPDLTWSGPGQIDLFGQSLPTTLTFTGPVRPKLQLSQITINSQLTTFVRGARPAGATRLLGSRLASGWLHYFSWETALAGAGALVGLGAVAGWRRLPKQTTVKLLAAGLVVAEAVNVGAIMIATYRAPGALRQVHSLNQLVGNDPVTARIHPAGPSLPGVQAVVIGDSTAAGAGLSPLPHGSRADLACGRSADSYASDLATANDWHVLNAACDSATIRAGLLGSQPRGSRHLPPQLATAERAGHASVVIVSIGADDLGWATMVAYCAAAPRCDDRATTAYFQQQLASFSKDYLQLLSQLATLPGHPRVIITR